MAYICPNAREREQKDFIVCALRLENEADIKDIKKALKAFCAHQRYCSCKKKVINTEKAEECYKQNQ